MNQRTLKGFTVSITIALLAAISPAASGGLKLPSMGTQASSGVSIDSFSKSSADAAGQILAARIAFFEAQAKLMEALGLKTDSVVKAREALEAKNGASTNPGDKVTATKDSKKVTDSANKEIDEALAKSGNLSDESKAKFAEGTGKFIQGVFLEKAQLETITTLVTQGKSLMSSAGMMDKMKVAGMIKPVTELSSMVPGDIKEATTTLGKIMKFAKSQNITNIPNSEKATADLGDLGT